MNKLSFFLILFLLFPIFVSAEEPTLFTASQDNELVTSVENINFDSRIVSISSTKDIKAELLANPFVIKADAFLQKGNFVSLILFGVDYSFSLFFLVALAIWIFFVLSFYSVINGYSTFSPLVSFLVSLCLGIINAQMGTIKWLSTKTSSLFLWCYSLFTGGQTLVTELIVIIGFFIIVAVVITIIAKFGTQMRENRKKFKEDANRLALDLQVKTQEAFQKGLNKKIK